MVGVALHATAPSESDFPVPGTAGAVVVVPAPGAGPGFWAGAPSAALAANGTVVIAYRLRSPDDRGARVAVARSGDGIHLETVATFDKRRFAAESLERPALVRFERGWRLYMSCATPGTKHWRIGALDAVEPAALADATTRTVFAGSDRVGVKDPVVRRHGDG